MSTWRPAESPGGGREDADEPEDAGRPSPGQRLRRWLDGVKRSPSRLRDRIRRARNTAGHERDVALLLAKSAIAGILSWTLADYVFASPQPTYAPFTALLVVQSTVYRTLLQSVQYVVAVLLGVLVAALSGSVIVPALAAFAVMLVIGLLGGRWNRLGTQGMQVPVAGIFAFNSLSGNAGSQLTNIITMVLLGAGAGVLSNLLLLPPMRYRDAAQGVRELSDALHTLLCDMATGLREDPPGPDTAEDWARRATNLDGTARKARQALEHGAESVSYNPRRLITRKHPASFAGYRSAMECLERAVEQVRSITRGIQHASEDQARSEDSGPTTRRGPSTPGADFLRSYAELLDLAAAAARDLGHTAQGSKEEYKALDEYMDEGRKRYDELTEQMSRRSEWPASGALLIDADRLLQEFARLQRQASAPPPGE